MNNKFKGRIVYHLPPRLSDNNLLLNNEHDGAPIKNTLTTVEENSKVNKAEQPEMLVVNSKDLNNILFFEGPDGRKELLGAKVNTQWHRNLTDNYHSTFRQYLSLSDPIIELDENYCITYINREASLALKKKPEELIGKTLTTLYPEVYWEPMKQAYKMSWLTKKTLVFDQFVPSLNKWYSARIYHRSKGLLILFYEITYQKTKIKILEEKGEKYQMLVENMSDVIFTLDLDLNVRYISPSVEKLLGEEGRNFLLKPLGKIICDEPLKMFKKLFIKEMNQKHVFDYGKHRTLKLETQYLKTDGSTVWLSIVFSFLRDYEGNLNEIRGVMQNITHQVNAALELVRSGKKIQLMEEELDELRSQLALKDEELHKALREADKCNQLKSAFLANMRHEIRTPMNGILGYAELLKDSEPGTEQQANYLQVIDQCGQNLLNVIDDIMCISMIESNLVKIHNSKININMQINSVYDLCRNEAKQKGIDFFYYTPSEEMIICTDKEKIHVVFTKLVNNALKFTKAGSVEFGYSFQLVDGDCCLVFYVKDTGIGISEEKHGIIFDKFRQGDESLRRNHDGIGLGLAISKAYVEMLGGKIWVESTVGKGSVFYFTIPLIHLSEC